MIGAMRTPDDQRWYRLSIAGVVIMAWVVLGLWGASPYAGLLQHHRGTGDGNLAPVLRLVLFVLGWTLMSAAMMLPGSLPLVNLFRKLTLNRPDHSTLVLWLGLGYLGTWAVFGALLFVIDRTVVHAVVERLPSLGAGSGIAALTLLVAGVYQFTPLKHMCLEKCRSPYSFVVEYWQGRRPSKDALRLGARHGLFCVGCCWTLMLLMFAVGLANLGWMLVLGALMAAERTTRWGRYLTGPLGLALVLWAVLVLAGRLSFPAS